MLNRRAISAIIFIALFALISWFSISMIRGYPDQSLSRIRSAKTIRIGYAVESPFVELTADGEVTGESPAIARRVVSELGIEHIVWVQTTFDALIPELDAGRFDVIAAGMFITPDRVKRVAFSRPTFRTRPGILVRRGNPHRIHSGSDLNTLENLRIAVVDGAVEKELLLGWGLAEKLMLVPDASTGLASVTSGLADGLVLSSVTIRRMAESDRTGSTEAVIPLDQTSGVPSPSSYGGFVFRKSDQTLQEAWDKALEEFLGTQSHRLTVAEFGFGDEEFPDRSSVNEVLSP